MKKILIMNPSRPACILLICLACIFCGCGKKDMPLPPLKETPLPPFLLSVDANNGEGFLIKWTHPSWKKNNSDHHAVKGFEMFAAKREISMEKCRGCPLEFHKIASLPPSVFKYSYSPVKGYRYFIRLRAFSDLGVFSPWSKTIELDYQ